MNLPSSASSSFHRFSVFTLFVGALLIWWGAATTTEHAGMAFGDWPLSNGSLNPQGWLHITPFMLEHGHRLLAGTVGFLVLTMFIWQWRQHRQPWYEVPLLAGTVAAIIVGGSKSSWTIVILGGAGCITWLIKGLLMRQWPTLLKLTNTAIIVVVSQAVLGGIRVLMVSDHYGIVHGCLGQLFYCLLIGIALVSSPNWGRRPMLVPVRMRSGLVKLTTCFFFVVFMQLVFGAIIRHTHRFDLAATDVLTTGGDLVPWGRSFDLVALFMHKAWALVVFTFSLMTALVTWRLLAKQGKFTWIPLLLLVLPIVQLTLGVYVILTVKKFWVTNFHVINGLLILATSFILMVFVRYSVSEIELRGTHRDEA
jgi:cytochrome c oxidase assembly protein subunit 15